MSVQLHVNVDHVATLRQVRRATYPDPVIAANLCELAGAHGITVHLRADRRHIQLRDVELLRAVVRGRLNVEAAPDAETLTEVLAVKPDRVTLVPERREELTTEGGLDVRGQRQTVAAAVAQCSAAGVPVSLFVDPCPQQIAASFDLAIAGLELHTGRYANAAGDLQTQALAQLAAAAQTLEQAPRSLQLAAGHGLTLSNVPPLLAAVPTLRELNIGHALVAEALYVGMGMAVQRYLQCMQLGAASAPCVTGLPP